MPRRLCEGETGQDFNKDLKLFQEEIRLLEASVKTSTDIRSERAQRALPNWISFSKESLVVDGRENAPVVPDDIFDAQRSGEHFQMERARS